MHSESAARPSTSSPTAARTSTAGTCQGSMCPWCRSKTSSGERPTHVSSSPGTSPRRSSPSKRRIVRAAGGSSFRHPKHGSCDDRGASMKFASLPVAGAFTVIREPHHDPRGSFARIWASAAFGEHGLAPLIAETSISHTSTRGTLRGLHYQVAPHSEAKLVTCLRGAIWDVVLDLRRESPTHRRWHGQRVAGTELGSLYVPEGVAHGLLTLT